MAKVLEKIARNYLRNKGLTVLGRRGGDLPDADFHLAEYKRQDGTFDYESYRRIQNEGNIKKLDRVWADEKTIGLICDYIQLNSKDLTRGICHGVRRGVEQRWFSEKLNIPVIGTDIGESASHFPNTVQWDFHERNADWVGGFDFVYTNSHDHAYDPKKAFDAWIEQLKPDGMLFIEHSLQHNEISSSKLDPFAADAKMMPFIILKWAQGRYAVSEILEPDFLKNDTMKSWIFVIRPNLRDQARSAGSLTAAARPVTTASKSAS